MTKKIAIIGGSGFAKEVIEVAEMLGHSVYGIFADELSNIGYEYKGYLDELLTLKNEFDGAIVAIGVVNKKGLVTRQKIINFLVKNNITQISLISPSATLGKGVKVGNGTYIAHDVIIALDSHIGSNVLINTSARIGHDNRIDDNVSIGPQVFLGGGTKITNNVMIGAASTLIQGIEVGEFSVIGMKSLVIKSLKPHSFVFTLPSRITNNAN